MQRTREQKTGGVRLREDCESPFPVLPRPAGRQKRERGECFVGWYRTASSNVSVSYRILDNFRLADRWHQRAAEAGDGDAMTEWGYCLQHGVGIRKDDRAAERVYRLAIRSKWITDYCREEARYH